MAMGRGNLDILLSQQKHSQDHVGAIGMLVNDLDSLNLEVKAGIHVCLALCQISIETHPPSQPLTTKCDSTGPRIIPVKQN